MTGYPPEDVMLVAVIELVLPEVDKEEMVPRTVPLHVVSMGPYTVYSCSAFKDVASRRVTVNCRVM
jgi:hypothetical protein